MPETITKESCIGLWEQQLESAANQLAIKNAAFAKQQAAFADISTWVVQLQTCLDSLGQTDKERDEVVRVLNLFIFQAESVCENVDCLKQAMEVLYCDIIQVSTCVEDLAQKVIDIKEGIGDLDSKITPEKSETLKCLLELETQIQKVIAMFQTMVDNVLNAAATIYRMECLLCSTDYGLLNKLADLMAYFGGEAKEDYCSTDHATVPSQSSSKSLCEATLESPEFPLAESDFYQDMTTALNTALRTKAACEETLEDTTKERDTLAACTSSLERAIEEAKKAETAK